MAWSCYVTPRQVWRLFRGKDWRLRPRDFNPFRESSTQNVTRVVGSIRAAAEKSGLPQKLSNEELERRWQCHLEQAK